jgi:hypothetical protein
LTSRCARSPVWSPLSCASIRHVRDPTYLGAETRSMPGSADVRRATDATAAAFDRGAAIAIVNGCVPAPGNRCAIVSATTRALCDLGITRLSLAELQ